MCDTIDDYSIGREITGEGGFGVIHVAKHYETGELVIMKIMNKQDLIQSEMYDQIQQELKIHHKLRHKNVVEIINHFEDDDLIYIVLKYMIKGDLFDYLYNSCDGVMSENEAKKYIYQIARGLKYLHSVGVIHRDIKLENLLLDEFDCVKIGDFGWSVEKSSYNKNECRENKGENIKIVCGTKEYMSPEILRGDVHDEKVDIWSLGIIMHELLTGSIPFKKKFIENDVLFKKHVLGLKIKYPSKLSKEAVDLMKKMLEKDPNKRITAEQIMSHEWLKEHDCETTEEDMQDDQYSSEEELGRRNSI